MCELAILDPRRNSAEIMTQAAMDIYQRMHSSLGLVTIRDPDTQAKFEFDIFKEVDPEREGVAAFMETAKEHDDAVRVIIHGRLATQGEVNREHAHPLRIDCPECEAKYVLHNGIITQFDYVREQHKEEGHEYTTNVDSEVLAHEFGEMPDDFSEEVMDVGAREPAYVLLSEDTMFVRSNHYHLAEDGRMARSRRNFGPLDHEDDYEAVIMNPTEPEKEVAHA